MRFLRSTILLAVIFACVSTHSTPCQTFLSADIAANGGCPSLSNPSSAAMISTPGLIASEYGYSFDLGWERKYQLKEFDQIFLSTTVVTPIGAISAGFDQFGTTNLYREKTARLVLSHLFGDIGGGILIEGSQVSFQDGYSSLSRFSLGCGVSVAYSHLVFAVTGYDLNSPSYADGSLATSPNGRFQVEYNGANSATASAYLKCTDNAKPQFGIGQRLNLSSQAELIFGAETLPTEYSAGLLLWRGKSCFSYAATYHADLGVSHIMSFGFGWGE
jgi:hypothetical protein